jgi:hypothetical protein
MSSSFERVDRLTAPPVVGRYYLVRIVRGFFFGLKDDWPVVGPQHDDVEFFRFAVPHYHVDHRFVRCSDERAIERQSSVFHGRTDFGEPLSAPRWSRRKCVRTWFGSIIPATRHVNTAPLHDLRAAFAGKQCAKSVGGFVCPHRNVPLGSIEQSAGVITCPLHGLRIDARTGIVLGPEGWEKAVRP